MPASRCRVIPIAHSGASWGRRELLRVNRLVKQRDAGDAEGEDIQRRRYGEGPVEDPQQLGLQRGLIQEVAAIQPEFILQCRYQRRHRGGSNAQAQPRLRDFRKAAGESTRN